MLTIDIVTLFPEFFKSPLGESLLEKAQAKKLVRIRTHDLRDWTHDRHKTADDKPWHAVYYPLSINKFLVSQNGCIILF